MRLLEVPCVRRWTSHLQIYSAFDGHEVGHKIYVFPCPLRETMSFDRGSYARIKTVSNVK